MFYSHFSIISYKYWYFFSLRPTSALSSFMSIVVFLRLTECLGKIEIRESILPKSLSVTSLLLPDQFHPATQTKQPHGYLNI